MIKLDLFPEVETKISDLLDHNTASDLKLRIFNTVASSSILAIVLQETADSFLVALPCRLMANGDKRLIEPQMPVRFARFMKPTILYVTPCFGEFEVFYIRHLLDQGKEQYPELITGEFAQKLVDRFEKLKEQAIQIKQDLEAIAGPVQDEEPNAAMMQPPAGKYKH